MHDPSPVDSGHPGGNSTWHIDLEPWENAWEDPNSTGGVLAWAWHDGEMQEAMAVAIPADEQARRWAEIDLPVLVGRNRADGLQDSP